MRHPRTLATFSDSGAHVCQEMGSSPQTHMLSYWVRAKEAFTLEHAEHMDRVIVDQRLHEHLVVVCQNQVDHHPDGVLTAFR